MPSLSHTQSALSNCDILREIFEQALGSHQTLYSCSRVCKTFCDPALSTLWRRLNNLMVLMRLLEPSLTRVEDGGHDDANKPYVLSGELLPGQFARFQQYARYVRIVDALYDHVDFTVFVHLSHLNHGRPILPALQNLTWLRTSLTTPELPFIIPRYLRTLVLMLDEVADDQIANSAATLLRLLAMKAPLIESLFLSISSELTPLLDLSPISAFKYLRSLDLGAWSFLDFHFLQQLSCMQNLSFLRAGALNIAPASGAIPAIGEFQALESLNLYSDVHQSTTLFSVISFPVLRMVTIHSYETAVSIQDCRLFLDVMSSKLGSSLCSLSLHVFLLGFATPSSTEILRPLFILKNLQSFTFECIHSGLSFSDQDISDLAMAWPRITSISFDMMCFNLLPPLRSLVHFARHCPHLKRLSFPCLDFLAVPRTERDCPVLSHGLEELILIENLRFPIRNPLAVAQYIDCIFPEVDSYPFRTSEWGGIPQTGWKQMAKYLDALKLARRRQMQRQALEAGVVSVSE